MAVLPVDEEALQEICEDIARDNYGFLYIAEHRDTIKHQYENANTGRLNTSSLSRSELRETLDELATESYADFEKIRDGVYYFDPFTQYNDQRIKDELTRIFSNRIVVTDETLRERFSLALDDLDFFVDQLTAENRQYLRRIAAGKQDYYTVGPRLKEHADDVGLESKLSADASRGKISHRDLETVINISATTDVIRFLEREGYIVDLGGEYLVKSALDEYGRSVAEEIKSDIESELAASEHVMRESEFRQLVENYIRERYTVLSEARDVKPDILDAVTDSLVDRIGLEMDMRRGENIVVVEDEFNRAVENRARRILDDVEANYDTFGQPSVYVERAQGHFEELEPTTDGEVNGYFQSAVEDQYEALVREEKF